MIGHVQCRFLSCGSLHGYCVTLPLCNIKCNYCTHCENILYSNLYYNRSLYDNKRQCDMRGGHEHPVQNSILSSHQATQDPPSLFCNYRGAMSRVRTFRTGGLFQYLIPSRICMSPSPYMLSITAMVRRYPTLCRQAHNNHIRAEPDC